MIDDGGALDRGERAFPSAHIGGRPFDTVRRVAGPGAVHQAHEAATAGEFGSEGGARGPGAEDDVEIAVSSGHGDDLSSGKGAGAPCRIPYTHFC